MRPSEVGGLVRIGLAGLLGIVFVVMLISDAASGDDPPAALVLTEYDLLSRAGTLEPRPYWVGRQVGTDRFELESDSDGSVYVRYLSGAVESDDALTVATYLVPDARASLRRAAREGDDLQRGDGFTTLAGDDSDSAYVVFDEAPEIQVEVYSPWAGLAKDLVRSGAATPLGWTPLG